MKRDYLINISYSKDRKRHEKVDELARRIILNKEHFNFVYFNKFETTYFNDKETNYQMSIMLSEINKNIEIFKSSEFATDLISSDYAMDMIKYLNDTDKNNLCMYCGSLTLNNTSYTYREYSGCISKTFECPTCRLIESQVKLNQINEKRETEGEAVAKRLSIEIVNSEYSVYTKSEQKKEI